jgi:hypothetical protein
MKKSKKIMMKLPLVSILICFIIRVLPGFRVYRELVWKFGESALFLGTFLPASGDSYLLGMFYNSIKKHLGAENTAVLASIGGSPAAAMELFPPQRSVILTAKQATDLVHFSRFFGSENLPIIILHSNHGWMYQQISGSLYGYRGLNLLSLNNAIFKLPDNADITIPKFDSNKKDLEKIFMLKGLSPGKTVLISPYTKSMKTPTKEFWVKLVNLLQERGYTVCTNINGEEKAIYNTVDVNLPYRQLVPFLEMAGTLICARSGLADIASRANCKKIILYPSDSRGVWGVGTALESFSLVGMGLCNDAIEMEISEKNNDEVISKILNIMK